MTALISLSSPSDFRSPALSVVGGVHQGVVLSLDKPLYTLGSALHCDLVLSDADIAKEHLLLRVSDHEVAIEARGGDVLVVGKGAQPVSLLMGSGHRTRLPVEIHIGSVRLSLTQAENPARAAPSARRLTSTREIGWLCLCALTVLLLGGSAFALQDKPDQVLPSVAATPAPLASPMAVTMAQARQWVEQRLQAEDMHSVVLAEAGDQLVAMGSVERSKKSRWSALQQAFDQRFGAQWNLRSSVTVRAEIAAPRVRFQAVWFGNDPYVINDNGKRLFPGAALPDNWVLERIEAHEVVLSRGEERFTLTL
ncbi:SctD/MshK family protein [Pseudomonas fluorescens]|uniref:Expansin-like CBD domain-containing protein n=1 Tax=Pseudomonas fluorescens TaxID=294 RepID=A0A0F4V9E7_PSEFL|nr:EscD/YscD/HrpQ family type III secretion system periplasmic domain-containing protein [Pseudomonas fluorescens]KJZ64582.1 hypothetical protein VD17_17050 [Pseudomonas fluorescens]